MKRYKKIFKENKIQEKDNLLYFGINGINIQSPFNMDGGQTRFDTPIPFSKISGKDKVDRIERKQKEINKELNEIRKVLYEYILTKVSELQEEILK